MGRVSKNKLIDKCKREYLLHYGNSEFSTVIAPGRINIIGEHTDYNLGFAMPIAIDRWICSIVSKNNNNINNIYSLNFNTYYSFSVDNFNFASEIWKKYIYGCIKVFRDKYSVLTGFNVVIGGNIPIGFGLSSSAALEVSLLKGLSIASNIDIDNFRLLELASIVEREILNIKSGLLDQYASIFSKKDTPLIIDFSKPKHSYIDINIRGASWILVNSLVDRELILSKYNKRVQECEDALKYIKNLLNINISINDITKEHLNQLKNNDGDIVFYKRIYHVITENKRVKSMSRALKDGHLFLIGRLLNESHSSLSKNYEVSCHEINEIVKISKKQSGFYGGRIMGGGFGGCTVNLVKDSKKEIFIKRLQAEFYSQFGYKPEIEVVEFADGLEII